MRFSSLIGSITSPSTSNCTLPSSNSVPPRRLNCSMKALGVSGRFIAACKRHGRGDLMSAAAHDERLASLAGDVEIELVLLPNGKIALQTTAAASD
jgi:hypothetical protein